MADASRSARSEAKRPPLVDLDGSRHGVAGERRSEFTARFRLIVLPEEMDI